mmetsp:Transcript_33944/g.71286  ORF Transcript_33944/g.71286 Transcript_33944/m.71286 type:complete len:208 (+) Transcript_33944:237-860(+)
MMCARSSLSGWSSPMAPRMSQAISTVLRWKLYTRTDLSATTRPSISRVFCVAMPVGQWLVLHLSDWMQPSANIMPRAELQMSAPRARVRTMPKPLTTLPEPMILILSRMPAPTRRESTRTRPSTSGRPMWLENSGGAAPVPPSAPSTVMKSTYTLWRSMAWTICDTSSTCPTQSLNPTGFPPDSSRSRPTNPTSSSALPKAECRGGL